MQVACTALLFSSAVVADAQSASANRAAAERAAPRIPIQCATVQGARERTAVARALRDSLSRILHDAVVDRAFPGAYVVVGDARGMITECGVGRLDWAPSPRVTERTLWDLASLTKVIGTTTALAQLVETGRVDLDAPVQRYVPDWRGPGKERVTVRHLLTHTSGLPAFRPYDRQTHNRDSIAALIFTTELERQPGDSMIYSDIGAFMMGAIVERVSGQRLDRYLAAHVFRPLKMTETMFNPPRSLRSRVAPTELDSTRGGLMRGEVHDERAYYLGGVAAHAGLFSTAADLRRFAAMLLHGGRLGDVHIMREATLAQFTAYADSAKSNRALGWQKAPAPWAGHLMSSRAFGHTGFTGTSIAVDPELDLYIILLSNRVNPTRNNPKIGDVRSHVADAVVSVVRRYRGLTTNAEIK